VLGVLAAPPVSGPSSGPLTWLPGSPARRGGWMVLFAGFALDGLEGNRLAAPDHPADLPDRQPFRPV
jgi:hypothetical protein